MLLSRVREFSYMYTQLSRKKRVVYILDVQRNEMEFYT